MLNVCFLLAGVRSGARMECTRHGRGEQAGAGRETARQIGNIERQREGERAESAKSAGSRAKCVCMCAAHNALKCDEKLLHYC